MRSAYLPDMPDLLTADELRTLDTLHKRTELVRGRLVVREPAGFRHGVVAMELATIIASHAKTHSLGLVVAAETGFKLASNPDTVRAPDVAFIRADRVPRPLPKGFPSLAPDLAVEVLSPDDRPADVLEKVSDWLRGGTRLVWVIDAERRLARVYRADGTEVLLDADGTLYGEDVLVGFSCRLSAVV
jgi:Uma2 family endonuclease